MMASLSGEGLGVSILDGLRKERGRKSSTSAAVSRRRVMRPSKNRLPADRIAAALGTQVVVPPQSAPPPPKVWVPEPALGAETRPDTGRHRGADAHLGHWVAPPATAAGLPRHARVAGSTSEEIAPVASSRPMPLPSVRGRKDSSRRASVGRASVRNASGRNAPVREVPTTVDAASGRHRQPASSKRATLATHRGSLGVQAHVRLFVVVGIVALVVAVAMIFGVRVVVSRSSAQTQLVATTTQNQVSGADAKTVAVPRAVPAKPHTSAR